MGNENCVYLKKKKLFYIFLRYIEKNKFVHQSVQTINLSVLKAVDGELGVSMVAPFPSPLQLKDAAPSLDWSPMQASGVIMSNRMYNS